MTRSGPRPLKCLGGNLRDHWPGRTLVGQDKSNFEIDAIFRNFPIFHEDLLFLDPRALDILECFGRALDAFLNGILEALFGTGNNFRNAGYRHCFLLR